MLINKEPIIGTYFPRGEVSQRVRVLHYANNTIRLRQRHT